MKRRTLLHLLLIFVIAASALAQRKPLDRSAPSVERLREVVAYLASDKLEGRRTGTPGADAAALYIAREFGRYGLTRSIGIDRPGMSILEADSPNRYLQKFPFVTGVEMGKNNSMLFTPRASAAATLEGARAASLDLRVQEDWMPLGFSSNARVENAAATFVGYGITATDLKYDDYAGADVTGRIAIAFAGTPDGDNPHGQFARYEGVRWKAMAARERGARALVVIASEENFKDDKLSRLRYNNSAGDAGLPVVVISRQVAGRLMEAAGLAPLAELEKALRSARSGSSGQTTASEGRKSLSAPLQNVQLTISTDIVRREAPASNVVGFLQGSDPKLKNETVVIGAHYDHLGGGGEESLAAREGETHHGADDNASGVAGMLELARILSAQSPRPKRTLIFIAFSGEEEGLLGSSFYVNHPAMPLAQTVAMINMDMIGRMKENRLIIGGVGTSVEWRERINAANAVGGMKVTAGASGSDRTSISGAPIVVGANGQPIVTVERGQLFNLTLNEDGYGPSDHSSFYAKQVPVLFFWTGTHDDYHKPSDNADKINYTDEARIVSFIADIVRAIDGNERRPTYTTAKSEATGRTTGFKVYLGTIPNYADSNDGLKLDGVRDDSPAAKAGLKAGDVIVKLAGRDVRNLYDYTYVLGEMKAGQEYEVEVMRAGSRLKLKITPASRK